MKKNIPEIGVTGGPCGGKTEGLTEVSERLRDMGFGVYVVPEAAETIISGGNLDMREIVKKDPQKCYDIQRQILRLQMQRLEHFRKQAALFGGDKPVLLLDRAPMDNMAYMPREHFWALLKEMRLNLFDARDVFDGVVHLVTAADGAEEFYTRENSPVRSETPKEARVLDKKTQWAWVGAPHFRIIDNSTNFEIKKERLLQAILGILGEPEPLEIERKFLLARRPDFRNGALRRSEIFCIEQMYLTGPDGEDSRIRKRSTLRYGHGRSQGDSTAYYRTKKVDIRPRVRREEEELISFTDYSYLKVFKDLNTRVIRKHRYCFVYNNQYFEMDIFISPENIRGLCLLETELLDENDPIDLPSFLDIKEEVTENPIYTNYALAKRK